MMFAEHLNLEQKKQFDNIAKPKLSRRDVEVMGVRRGIYKRNRGAIRRR